MCLNYGFNFKKTPHALSPLFASVIETTKYLFVVKSGVIVDGAVVDETPTSINEVELVVGHHAGANDPDDHQCNNDSGDR